MEPRFEIDGSEDLYELKISDDSLTAQIYLTTDEMAALRDQLTEFLDGLQEAA